jgi:hypothetical protein
MQALTRSAMRSIVILLIVGFGHVTAQDHTRMRTHHRRILGAMIEGQQRSMTFNTIFDRVASSDLIVYLESGRCASIHVLSCLAISSGANGQRYVRITIDTDHTRGLIIQQIAHELQHAAEIATAPEVVDAPGLRSLYRQIGRAVAGPDTFETTAAALVAAAVSAEMR